MMNAPADRLARPRGAPAGARVAVGHPARPRRDDRDPRRRRRRRGLGPAAAPQGGRRVGDPRPADREDRPVTAHRPDRPRRRSILRRLDLAAADPGDAGERVERLLPPRRRPERRPCATARGRSSTTSGPAARRRSSRPASTFGGAPADGRLVIERAELAAAADRLPADVRRALDQAIANVRAFAEAQRPQSDDRRRSSPASRSSAAGCRSTASAATSRAAARRYPSSLVMTVVPALRRRRRRDRRRVARRPGRRRRPDRRSAPPACSASGRCSSPAAPRRSARSRSGCRTAGVEPVDRIVGPGNAWVTAAKLEVSSVVGIDLPAGPSEGMVLADGDADPVLVAADLVTQAEHGPDSPAILVTTDAARWPTPSRPRSRASCRASSAATSSGPPSATTAGSSSRPTSTPRSRSSTPTPRSTSRSTSRDAGGRRRPDPQRGLDLRRAVGARVRRRLRDRREPRPADRRPRPLVRPARRSRRSAASARSSGSTRRPRRDRATRSGRSRRPRA